MPGKLFWRRGEKGKVLKDIEDLKKTEQLANCKQWASEIEVALSEPGRWVNKTPLLPLEFYCVVLADASERWEKYLRAHFLGLGWTVETKFVPSPVDPRAGSILLTLS